MWLVKTKKDITNIILKTFLLLKISKIEIDYISHDILYCGFNELKKFMTLKELDLECLP